MISLLLLGILLLMVVVVGLALTELLWWLEGLLNPPEPEPPAVAVRPSDIWRKAA